MNELASNSFKSKDIITLAIVAYGKDYDANIDLGLIGFYRYERKK